MRILLIAAACFALRHGWLGAGLGAIELPAARRLRCRLQRPRDQSAALSGLRQPLLDSILPGYSDRLQAPGDQSVCNNGFNSCNNGCDALAAIPSGAAIQNQTACSNRCCNQLKVCVREILRREQHHLSVGQISRTLRDVHVHVP